MAKKYAIFSAKEHFSRGDEQQYQPNGKSTLELVPTKLRYKRLSSSTV